MLEFKDLELEDKQIIVEYFHRGQYQNSECTFTNLFIWRECYAVQWAIVNGFLLIKPAVEGESWILPPYGDYENNDVRPVIEAAAEYFAAQEQPLIIRALTEDLAAKLQQQMPEAFVLEEERDLFDYVYLGEDLRLLKGRKYHSKRNHLSNFKKNYPQYVYRTITKEDIPALIEYLEVWRKQKETLGKFDQGMICERKAILEAFKYMDELDYCGAVIEIDGQIEAFTLGEKVNEETVVIHVEKANGLINGLYSLINQEFLLHQWPEVTYVNREEDTGDEGLRKAKSSYYPIELLKKYKGVYQG